METSGMEGDPKKYETEEAARRAARETRDEISRLGDEMKQRGSHLLQEQRDMVAHQVGSVANALRAGADSFDDDGQAALAGYSRDIASRIDNVSNEIRTRDVDGMLTRARGYARENPALVIGGAALCGFLVARFLKSTSHDEDIPRDLSLSPVTTSEPMFDAPRFGDYERR